MLDIFSGLRLVVKRRSINIDNAIFRCHWFFTSTLLVSFSLIITARQYVGQPIECHSVDRIPDSLLNSYCWVQGTFTVPQACSQRLYGVELPYPCIDNTRGREIKVYAYYQWVGIVLFIQGLLFHLPYYLWKLWENGLIKAITGGLRVAVLNELERAKKKEIVVDYIHDHLGCHRRYALKYFLCEFICLVNLVGQLWATNRFFDGQFLRYGLDVLEYSSSQQLDSAQPATSSSSHASNLTSLSATHARQTLPAAGGLHAHTRKQLVDPMTYIFPRMTKCTYFDFGSSGDVQRHDALCLLPLNIINEKIYIALWFWFLILAILTLLVIVYRVCAMLSESVRCKGLISRCKLSSERDIRLICRHCDVGDWFLFYMVAENLDPLIMREIVAAIASKISEHIELKNELKAQLQQERLEQPRPQPQFERDKLGPRQVGELDERHSRLAAPELEAPADGRTPPGLMRKLKKRLYNKRLWSLDLGPAEARQQLLAGAHTHLGPGLRPPQPQSATSPASPASAPLTSVFNFASAPPASQMPLSSAALPHLRQFERRGSLTRKTSTASSSGVSSVASESFVMDMCTISGSSPCLDTLARTAPRQSPAVRLRNVRHFHET